MTDDEFGPEPTSRRTPVEIAVVVTVLVAVSVALFIGLGRGDDDAPDRSEVEAETATTVLGDRRIELHGVEVTIPAGALDPAAVLDADLRSVPTSHLRLMEPVSPILSPEITGGEQTGPISYSFPIDDVRLNAHGIEPVLMVLLIDGEDVEVVDGSWDRAEMRLRVDLDRPVDVGVVTWDWERLESMTEATITNLDGSPTPALACDAAAGEEPLEVGGAIAWCIGSDGVTRTIRGRNRSGVVTQIGWDGADLVDVDDPSEIATFIEGVPDWRRSDSLLVGPGATVRLTVPGRQSADISSRFDAEAPRLQWLAATARLISDLSDDLPGARSQGWTEVLDRLDPFCAVPVETPEELVRTCFDPLRIQRVLGEGSGPYLERLLRPEILGALLVDALDRADVDLEDGAYSDLHVERLAPSGGAWPVSSRNAPASLLEALDEDGYLAVWARCLEQLCLVGDGREVRVYSLQPVERPTETTTTAAASTTTGGSTTTTAPEPTERWRLEHRIPESVSDPARQLWDLGYGHETIDALILF